MKSVNNIGVSGLSGKLENNSSYFVVVVVVVVSHIQRIGCQPEKNYFTRWLIPLVVC